MVFSALNLFRGRLNFVVLNLKYCEPIYLPKRFISCGVNRLLSNSSSGSPQSDGTSNEDDSNIKQETRISTQIFFDSKEKNKKTFNAMLDLFKKRVGQRRGHVDFIYAAMKHLDEYGVQYDLQTYKNIITILPEDKYVPENQFQAEFVHYPHHQYCVVALLDKMESKGVCPDYDMMRLLQRRFGREGHPVRKCARMIYWLRKLKNASPWRIPFPPPTDPFLLAKLAIERIVTVDPQSEVSVYQSDSLPEAIDHTYIVSGISPTQKNLIAKHPKDKPIYVEGGFRLWLRTSTITYFILRADNDYKEIPPEDPDDFENLHMPILNYKNPKLPIERPSVHEQEDGTILAVCATGTSTRDSLLSWIRLLEKNGNPALGEIPILFTLKSPLGEIVPLNDETKAPPHDHEPYEKVSISE